MEYLDTENIFKICKVKEPKKFDNKYFEERIEVESSDLIEIHKDLNW